MRGLYTNQKRSIEHFGPMLCSCFFSYSYSASRYSYSYSKRSSISILPIGPQVPANRFDQRSASPQFKQPSSTSTVSLSTASLSTSTTKSDARHEQLYHFDSIALNPIGRYSVPRISCSRSIAWKRALKFPLPKLLAPSRWMISKNSVGRS